jgi:hypothetical protein
MERGNGGTQADQPLVGGTDRIRDQFVENGRGFVEFGGVVTQANN